MRRCDGTRFRKNGNKTPIAGKGWQDKGYTASEIESLVHTNPHIKAVGINTSKTNLVCIDLDGPKAHDFCQRHALPLPTTWSIGRNNDTTRSKLIYRVLPQKLPQRPGKRRWPDHQLEAFWNSHQFVVSGLHPSGTLYSWTGTPADISPLPDAWIAFLTLEHSRLLSSDLPPGNRNNGLLSFATDVYTAEAEARRRGAVLDSTADVLIQGVLGHTDRSDFPDSEVSTVLQSARQRTALTQGFDKRWLYANRDHYAPTKRDLGKFQSLALLLPSGANPGTGKPTTTQAGNIAGMFTLYLRKHFAYNELFHSIEHKSKFFSENDRKQFLCAIQRHGWRISDQTLMDALQAVAAENAYNPVHQYLTTNTTEPLPLDQHLLGLDDPLAAKFLPRHLISAVARVLHPGASVRQTPVLVGPQWRGKTALGCILFGGFWAEGVGRLDRDALMKCHSAWGIELAELDGVTRRSDQESLKAFLTEQVDTYRKPYARTTEQHPRRFVFWGTSNAAPLRDPTGSTRLVTIPIPDRMLPLDWAIEHRDAIWARAVEQYRAGVDWDRCDEAERQLIAERNENFTEIDPWTEAIEEILNSRQQLGNLPVKLPELLDGGGVPKDRQDARGAKRVRQIAVALGWGVA